MTVTADPFMQEKVRFYDQLGKIVGVLKVAPSGDSARSPIKRISDSEALEYGEETIQVVEGGSYQYELESTNLRLVEDGSLIKRFVFGSSTTDRGMITPGNRVGYLPLSLSNVNGDIVSKSGIEIVSKKVGYRDDYRSMLEDISEWSLELLLIVSSPVETRLASDFSRSSSSLLQQFFFIKGLLNCSRFKSTIEAIISRPHSRLWQDSSLVPIAECNQYEYTNFQDFLTSSPRVPISSAHPLHAFERAMGVSNPSAPAVVEVEQHYETIDTPENQFVKYTIETFKSFLEIVSSSLERQSKQSALISKREVEPLKKYFDQIMAHGFFREVSMPSSLNLGSPVLQRKHGYRELLDYWQKFNLASILSWDSSDDLFGGGIRDIAKLYEYWLFFALLKIISKHLGASGLKNIAEKLINKTADGYSLKISAGQSYSLAGTIFNKCAESLNFRYSYNRVFEAGPFEILERKLKYSVSYPSSGSWTKKMIPDFTFSFWPIGQEEGDAELNEDIVHVHFDAKYSVSSLLELFGAGEEASIEISNKDSYSRKDVLKMHAYKDAIRRSYGAYILYPGVSEKVSEEYHTWLGYHEVLPGLGAFTVRPGENSVESLEVLSAYFEDLIEHLLMQPSARSKVSKAIKLYNNGSKSV